MGAGDEALGSLSRPKMSSFVLQVLRVPQPRLTRSAYDLDQLLDELVRPIGAVREAEIHKRRTRFTLGGCMAELTDVIADGRSTRTVAVESEDAGAVLEAVRSVGLDNYLNVSYRARADRAPG